MPKKCFAYGLSPSIDDDWNLILICLPFHLDDEFRVTLILLGAFLILNK